eukprot:519022-Amphidinium_carterae.1
MQSRLHRKSILDQTDHPLVERCMDSLQGVEPNAKSVPLIFTRTLQCQTNTTKASRRYWCRANTSDHQYHTKEKQNNKFQELRYTPTYWRTEHKGVYQ